VPDKNLSFRNWSPAYLTPHPLSPSSSSWRWDADHFTVGNSFRFASSVDVHVTLARGMRVWGRGGGEWGGDDGEEEIA